MPLKVGEKIHSNQVKAEMKVTTSVEKETSLAYFQPFTDNSKNYKFKDEGVSGWLLSSILEISI